MARALLGRRCREPAAGDSGDGDGSQPPQRAQSAHRRSRQDATHAAQHILAAAPGPFPAVRRGRRTFLRSNACTRRRYNSTAPHGVARTRRRGRMLEERHDDSHSHHWNFARSARLHRTHGPGADAHAPNPRSRPRPSRPADRGRGQPRRPEARRRRARGQHGQAGAGSRRFGLQLRRARLPGGRDLEVPHRGAREERLQDHARPVGHPDRVGGHVRQRQAGDRARLRHRRHPAGVAEAGRGVSRPDHRGRARARRGPQHRHAAQHRRGHRGEARDGAREAAGHADALAGRGRGARGQQGVVRPRRHVQGRRRHAVHARRQQPQRVVGRRRRQRPRLGGVHVRRRDRAQRRCAVARTLGRRRGRADERRRGTTAASTCGCRSARTR